LQGAGYGRFIQHLYNRLVAGPGTQQPHQLIPADPAQVIQSLPGEKVAHIGQATKARIAAPTTIRAIRMTATYDTNNRLRNVISIASV
jgi:hypothetical protein